MGRPKLKEAKKQYTVMLKPSTVKEIDKTAKILEMPRSQFMANLIDMGLDDAKILNDLGVFKLIMVGGRAARKLKKAFYRGELGFLEEDKE